MFAKEKATTSTVLESGMPYETKEAHGSKEYDASQSLSYKSLTTSIICG